MALFNLKLKDLEQGFNSLVGNVGNVVKGITNPTQGLNMLNQGIRSVFPQQPQQPAPRPQQQTPQFDFKSTFRQPGAPAPQAPTFNVSPSLRPLTPQSVVQSAINLPKLEQTNTPGLTNVLIDGKYTPVVTNEQQYLNEKMKGQPDYIRNSYTGKQNQAAILAKARGDVAGEIIAGFNMVADKFNVVKNLNMIVGAAAGATPEQIVTESDKVGDFGRAIAPEIWRQTSDKATGLPLLISQIPAGLEAITKEPAMYLQREGGKFFGKTPKQIQQQQDLYNKVSQDFQAESNKIQTDLFNVLDSINKENTDFANQLTPQQNPDSNWSKYGDQAASVGVSISTMFLPGSTIFLTSGAAGRVYREMRDNDIDQKTAADTASIYAIVEGQLEKIGFRGLTKGASALNKGLLRGTANYLVGFGSEGSTESLQQLTENILRKNAGDQSIQSIWQGVAESFVIGGLVGAPFNVVAGESVRKNNEIKYRNIIERAVDATIIEAQQKAIQGAGNTALYGPQISTFAQAAPGVPLAGSAVGMPVTAGLTYGEKAPGFADAQSRGQIFTGPDGKKRFELSDAGATINYARLSKPNTLGYSYKLSDLLKHDVLFKQYPHLADMRVIVYNEEDADGELGKQGWGGYITDVNGDPVVLIRAPNFKNKLTKTNLLDTLLHENQHVIQGIEGFAPGSSNEIMEKMEIGQFVDSKIAEKMFPNVKDASERKDLLENFLLGKNYNEFGKWASQYSFTNSRLPSEKLSIKKIIEIYGPQMNPNLARYIYSLTSTDVVYRDYLYYLMTLGEWEARQTGARRTMTQEQIDAASKDFNERYKETTDLPLNRLLIINKNIQTIEQLKQAIVEKKSNLQSIVDRFYAPRPGQDFKGDTEAVLLGMVRLPDQPSTINVSTVTPPNAIGAQTVELFSVKFPSKSSVFEYREEIDPKNIEKLAAAQNMTVDNYIGTYVIPKSDIVVSNSLGIVNRISYDEAVKKYNTSDANKLADFLVNGDVPSAPTRTEIGITPFRGKPVKKVDEAQAYYDTTRAKGFESSLETTSQQYGLTPNVQKATGSWEGGIEPSYQVAIESEDIVAVEAYASENGQANNQDAVLLFTESNRKGNDTKYSFDWSLRKGIVTNIDEAIALAHKNGISGITAINNKLEIVDFGNELKDNISKFSQELGVAPSVVVGKAKLIEKENYESHIQAYKNKNRNNLYTQTDTRNEGLSQTQEVSDQTSSQVEPTPQADIKVLSEKDNGYGGLAKQTVKLQEATLPDGKILYSVVESSATGMPKTKIYKTLAAAQKAYDKSTHVSDVSSAPTVTIKSAPQVGKTVKINDLVPEPQNFTDKVKTEQILNKYRKQFSEGKYKDWDIELDNAGGKLHIKNGNHKIQVLKENGIETLNVSELPTGTKSIKASVAPQVGKTDALDALKAEARKYKSAEEFVKAQPTVYHGTTENFAKGIEAGGFKPDAEYIRTLGQLGNIKGKATAIFFSENKNLAEGFGKNRADYFDQSHGVVQAYISPKAKILDLTKLNDKNINVIDSVISKMKAPKGYSRADNAESLFTGSSPIGGGRNFRQLVRDGEINIKRDIAMVLDSEEFTKALREAGYDGIKLLEPGKIDLKLARNISPEAIAVLNPDVIKTKSQLTDIYNQANAPQVGKSEAAATTIKKDLNYESNGEFVVSTGNKSTNIYWDSQTNSWHRNLNKGEKESAWNPYQTVVGSNKAEAVAAVRELHTSDQGAPGIQASQEVVPKRTVTVKSTALVPVKKATGPDVRQELISAEDLKQQNKQNIEETKGRYKKESLWRKVQSLLIDPFALAAEMDRVTGVTKKADSMEAALDVAMGNPDTRLRNLLSIFGITKGDKNNPALMQKYGEGTVAGEDFHLYRTLKFQQELNQTNNKQIIRDKDGLSIQPDNINSMVAELEAQYPGIEQDVLKLKAMFDKILIEAERVGLLEPGVAKATSGAYKYWSNIDRVFPDYVLKQSIGGKKVAGLSKQTVVQALTGGEAPVGTNWDTTMERLRNIDRQIAMQKSGNIFLKHIMKLQDAKKKVRGKILGTVIQSREDVLTLRDLKSTLAEIRDYIKKAETQRRRARENARVQRVAKIGTKQVLTVKVKAKERAARLEVNRAVKNLETKAKAKLRQFFPKELHSVVNNLTLEEIIAIADDFSSFETQTKFVTPETDITGVTPPSTGMKGAKKNVEAKLIRYKAGPTGINKTLELLARRSAAHAAFVDKWQALRTDISLLQESGSELRTAISEVSIDPTTGRQIITVLDQGIPVKIEVQPEVAKMILGFDQGKLEGFFKVMRYLGMPGRMVWTGVLNPVFTVVSETIYNTPMSIINSEQGVKVFAPKAVLESIKSLASSAEFQTALRDSGAQMAVASMTESDLQIDPGYEVAKNNIFKRFKYSITTKKGFKNAMGALDLLSGKLANITRTRMAAAAYFEAINKGYSHADAMAEAVYAYNNGMPNYGRSTLAMKKIDAVIPYTSASTAGTRAYGKSARNRPLKTLAYTALFTTPTIMLVATSLANMGADAEDEDKNYFTDMINSKKESILDDNYIIVLPGAKKDPKTNEWSGIIRIPVAPEFRGINKMLWRTTYEKMTGQDVASPAMYAMAILNTMTGGVFDRPDVPSITTILSVFLDKDIRLSQGTAYDITPPDLKMYDDKNERYKKNTSQAAKDIAKTINNLSGQKNGVVSPLQIEYLLNKGGFAGDVVQNPSDIFGQVMKRFQGGTGRSEGVKYYAGLTEDKDSIASWNQNDEQAYNSLHPRKKDSRGVDIWDDSVNIYNAKARDEIYNRYPNVLELDRKQNARNVQQGKPSNPLMELPTDQLRKVLSKEAMIPGQKDPELDVLYQQEWYTNYRSDKKGFFDGLKALSVKEGWEFAASDNPYPQTPPQLQAVMDQYSALRKGTGERSAWIRSNPQAFEAMKNQWAAIDDWQNRQRAKFGLAATEGAAGIANGFKEAYSQDANKKNRRVYQPRYMLTPRKPGRLKRVGAGRRITIKRPRKVVVKSMQV